MPMSIVLYSFDLEKKQDFFFLCFSLFYQIERRRINMKETLEM